MRKLARHGNIVHMTAQRYERIPVFTAGDRLRKARELAGLDQGALAEATGISRGTVSHLELNKAPLSRKYLLLWATVTGVSIEWLEHGEAAPTGPDGPTLGTTPKVDALAQLTRNKRARHAERTTREYVAAA